MKTKVAFAFILFMSSIGLTAESDQHGYRVLDIEPGSTYEKIGLQKGDVIRAYNNIPVDAPKEALDLYNRLERSERLKLQIERLGSPMVIDTKTQIK